MRADGNFYEHTVKTEYQPREKHMSKLKINTKKSENVAKNHMSELKRNSRTSGKKI